MAYFFTLLYLLTAYVTPPILFGPLSEYHIEIIVVLLAIFTSIPNMPGSGLGKAPQLLALAGLSMSILASIVQSGWLGGVVGPLYGFMQPTFAFILVAVNCKTRQHLRWIVLLFFLGTCFFMWQGIHALRAEGVYSPYLYGEGALRRLRGLGFVNDPNDLAQMMVSLVPAMFLWRQKNVLGNLFLIYIPIAVLIAGMYLTHSRGGMVALLVVVLLAARRKIGIVPGAIVAALLLGGLMASGWSGGRDVSMDAGADRLDLWYDGMETIKAHPLFGLGLNGFADKFGITAHNSVVICASELGTVGLFFWVLFLFSSIRRTVTLRKDGVVEKKPADVAEGAQQEKSASQRTNPPVRAMAGAKPYPVPSVPAREGRRTAAPPLKLGFQADVEEPGAAAEEQHEMAGLLLLMLAGFLTAGWFLSRHLSMWLFMYCGMVYAVSRMNRAAEESSEDKLSYLARWSVVVTIFLLLLLYIILRARNLGGH